MRKATLKCMDVCDRLAQFYEDKEQRGTIIEVIVRTSAEVGDRVKLPELGAERSVISSRWINSDKVVHFTAEEWLFLRGIKRALPHLVDAARQIMEPEPTA